MPISDKTLINDWLAVHEFWYEFFPNNIYDQCLQEFNNNNSSNTINYNYFIYLFSFFMMFFLK